MDKAPMLKIVPKVSTCRSGSRSCLHTWCRYRSAEPNVFGPTGISAKPRKEDKLRAWGNGADVPILLKNSKSDRPRIFRETPKFGECRQECPPRSLSGLGSARATIRAPPLRPNFCNAPVRPGNFSISVVKGLFQQYLPKGDSPLSPRAQQFLDHCTVAANISPNIRHFAPFRPASG